MAKKYLGTAAVVLVVLVAVRFAKGAGIPVVSGLLASYA